MWGNAIQVSNARQDSRLQHTNSQSQSVKDVFNFPFKDTHLPLPPPPAPRIPQPIP